MGLLEKFTRLFGSSGVIQDPDSLVSNAVITGAQNNKQLPDSWENWKIGRIEDRIQNITQNNPGPTPPGLTRDQLVQKHFSTSGTDGRYWAHMYDDINKFVDGTDVLLDLALYYPEDDHVKLLVLNQTDVSVDMYDTVTGVSSTSSTLGDLPSGGGEIWKPLQFVSDNEYVYVVFVDTGVGANIPRRVQAYSLVDWSKRSGWPATGIGITGTALLTSERIIDVNATYLCYMNSGVAITASSSAVLNLVRKDNGTIDDSGAGDSPTGSGHLGSKGLCTDGSYIYFTTLNPAAPGNVCSADITDLTTGCGGTNWPYAPIGTNGLDCGDLVYNGEFIISTWYQILSQNAFFILSQVADADFAKYKFSATGFYSDYIFTNMTFDSRNIWMRGDHDINGKPIILSINCGGFGNQEYQIGSTVQLLDPLVNKMFSVDASNVYTDSDEYKRMVCDGSNLWAVTYSLSDPAVRRIPNIGGI